MNYDFAESVVTLVSELEKKQENRFVSSARTYSTVIIFIRNYKTELTTEEVIDILMIFKNVLKLSEQVSLVDEGQRSYMSSNMVGNREFDKEYRSILNSEVNMSTMQLFLENYIKDLRIASDETKKDIEFSLRNLEYFLDLFCDFHEENLLTKRLVEILKGLVENR